MPTGAVATRAVPKPMVACGCDEPLQQRAPTIIPTPEAIINEMILPVNTGIGVPFLRWIVVDPTSIFPVTSVKLTVTFT